MSDAQQLITTRMDVCNWHLVRYLHMHACSCYNYSSAAEMVAFFSSLEDIGAFNYGRESQFSPCE